MQEEKLFKKGNPTKGQDGSLALVNENDEVYKVDEAVMGIWSLCDGISFKELVTAIADAANMDPSKINDMTLMKDSSVLVIPCLPIASRLFFFLQPVKFFVIP